jgi:DNA invertase Pin-like site-specific DNA recombinase
MITGGDLTPRPPNGLSEKIFRRHRERLAIVYIRQSTVQQVERHQESTRLQYALVDRAFHLGWARESIVVVDDDLGRSGATIEGRLGFQRLVAEVGLGRVGLVLGVEMSRLARSNRDWHQLLEICALFDTLIADVDGVYDPAHFNDRLLLGLKGTMSEAELHILKARMLEGRRAKARRGELGKPSADGVRATSLRRGGAGPGRAGASNDPPSVCAVPAVSNGRQGAVLPGRARHPDAGAHARRTRQRRT